MADFVAAFQEPNLVVSFLRGPHAKENKSEAQNEGNLPRYRSQKCDLYLPKLLFNRQIHLNTFTDTVMFPCNNSGTLAPVQPESAMLLDLESFSVTRSRWHWS